MHRFTTMTGTPAPLAMINVDTDMIIPKQFLKTTQRTGLGRALFHELRYFEDGTPNPDFVLNKPQWAKAGILVGGDNFGCGSSREHAPWALLDFGISCVIAPSFADIFYNNCFKNGILPVTLPKETVDALMEQAGRGANIRFTIDLEKQTVVDSEGTTHKFPIDSFLKHRLLNGLDDISTSLAQSEAIDRYEAKARTGVGFLEINLP